MGNKLSPSSISWARVNFWRHNHPQRHGTFSESVGKTWCEMAVVAIMMGYSIQLCFRAGACFIRFVSDELDKMLVPMLDH